MSRTKKYEPSAAYTEALRSLRVPVGHARTCPEKQFALALYILGVRKLQLSTSHWLGRPPSVDGLLVNQLSIVAEPYVTGAKPGEPGMWSLLKHLGIGASGCAGTDDGVGYMQASWSPKSTKHEGYTYWVSMSLPLVVCYFNAIVELQQDNKEPG
jgi:hypothetical protein